MVLDRVAAGLREGRRHPHGHPAVFVYDSDKLRGERRQRGHEPFLLDLVLYGTAFIDKRPPLKPVEFLVLAVLENGPLAPAVSSSPLVAVRDP
jgi:hypothetical protein